jgi:undecaprenyl-diphosphatase
MAKKQVVTKAKVSVSGLWWLAFFSLISFSAVAAIGFYYQSIYWQLIDSVSENIALSYRTDQLTGLMTAVTHFGYYGSLLIWLLILGILTVKREFRMLIMSLILSAGGVGLGYGLKLLVARIRPMEISLVTETTHSFPSLHAMTAVVLYLIISYLVYHFGRRFLLSYLVFVTGLILTLAIGFSRIYLGVHYLSDVLAGFSLGVGWFLWILFLEKCFCLLPKKAGKSVKIS